MAQKKNITNVFMVLSGLKKWLHQFSWCFTWNRSGREAAFAGPSLCKEHRDAGCFPSTVHWSPSEQEPHPRLKGHSPPTVRAYLPITAYHHHACRKQQRTNNFCSLQPSCSDHPQEQGELSPSMCQTQCDVLCVHDFISLLHNKCYYYFHFQMWNGGL